VAINPKLEIYMSVEHVITSHRWSSHSLIYLSVPSTASHLQCIRNSSWSS